MSWIWAGRGAPVGGLPIPLYRAQGAKTVGVAGGQGGLAEFLLQSCAASGGAPWPRGELGGDKWDDEERSEWERAAAA